MLPEGVWFGELHSAFSKKLFDKNHFVSHSKLNCLKIQIEWHFFRVTLYDTTLWVRKRRLGKLHYQYLIVLKYFVLFPQPVEHFKFTVNRTKLWHVVLLL